MSKAFKITVSVILLLVVLVVLATQSIVVVKDYDYYQITRNGEPVCVYVGDKVGSILLLSSSADKLHESGVHVGNGIRFKWPFIDKLTEIDVFSL